MKTVNNNSVNEQIALDFITKAKTSFKAKNFRRFLTRDYTLQTLFNQLKQNLVYHNKRYIHSKVRYSKGLINLEELKSISFEILKEQLKQLDNEKIDTFFRIRRR